MQVTHAWYYSRRLQRDMQLITYGSKGYPFLVFPTQDGKAGQWEDFGMIEVLRPFIENGAVRLYCIDSVDQESWSDTNGDKSRRAQVQEAYFQSVCEDVVPRIDGKRRPVTTGCSMGANHSVNTFLRRPDLFGGCLALSGVYDTNVFFGDWMDKTLYDNAPLAYLRGMPKNHPYVKLYQKSQIVVCVGQGAWEDEGVRTTRDLETQLARLGVPAWIDYWGSDVNHDWPWWKKQVVYFLPFMLEALQ
jgi:esterase/lipase superfamily enzyme